ncbi:MAG TPA: hypothetical protein VKN76_10915 [Kiloniellaceae bacterium]|nr:hypothetical protein [Kiloniellaceae bacterium]
MFYYVAAAGAVYGIGFVAVAVERASTLWDKMGTASLVQDAMTHGIAWPGLVVQYLA